MSKVYPFSHKLAVMLANPPAPGAGRHHWLFCVAASLIRQGARPAEVERVLIENAKAAGWADRVGDISRAVAAIAHRKTPALPGIWMPERSEEARAAALKTRPIFAPVPAGLHAVEILSVLFRPSELVCVGLAQNRFFTVSRDAALPWAPRAPFVVANPMRAPTGLTQEGKVSPRCLNNACLPSQRRYIVVEFDTGDTLEDQIRLLSSLHTRAAPLALAVFSGGKSIHGWFNVSALAPREKLYLFRRGALLGCDASLWDICKLVRMPGGLRDTGARQEVFYWEIEHAA
jgi:hypothetical protein